MTIKNISLIGAGAIGAYFIDGLEALDDVNFSIIAKGDRYDRLAQNGLTINGRRHMLNLKRPEEVAECDLLLITTKYDGLKSALEDIKTITKPNTIILSLLNGIDSEEIISTVVPAEQIVYSIMRISAQRQGNSVTYDPEITYGFTFGEKDTPEKTDRCIAIDELFNRTSIRHKFLSDIKSDMWRKFGNNIAFNLPQAVLDVPYGSYFDSEHMEYINKRLEMEVRSVAEKYGITFGHLGNKKDTCLPTAIFSTLQDIRASRHTEIEMFLGVFLTKAKEVGVDVPFAEYTYHAIKVIEEKIDGKFEY